MADATNVAMMIRQPAWMPDVAGTSLNARVYVAQVALWKLFDKWADPNGERGAAEKYLTDNIEPVEKIMSFVIALSCAKSVWPMDIACKRTLSRNGLSSIEGRRSVENKLEDNGNCQNVIEHIGSMKNTL